MIILCVLKFILKITINELNSSNPYLKKIIKYYYENKKYKYIYVKNKNFPVCKYIYLSNIDLY